MLASLSILSPIPGGGLMGGWAQATHSATTTATIVTPIHFSTVDASIAKRPDSRPARFDVAIR
jgi:hypothetical protein